jgi:hypothetical protein
MGQDELFDQVDNRAESVREYLLWSRENDNEERSFRMTKRPDIAEAKRAAKVFVEPWWGVVVFTCFGSERGAKVVAPYFYRPIPPPEARAAFDSLVFPRGSVGHHRVRPGVRGAKEALVSACENSNLFHDLLYSSESFDTRYHRLRRARLRQWGRTTVFDLLVRTGTLGIGGQHYKPEYAYLAGSSGPSAGFARVWGVSPTAATVGRCEAVLRAWTENWDAVSERVGVVWNKLPLEPCDQENFLCIYQKVGKPGGRRRRDRSSCCGSTTGPLTHSPYRQAEGFCSSRPDGAD